MTSRTIRAGVVGTGRIGQEVVRGIVASGDQTFVSAVVMDPRKAGRDVADLVPGAPRGVTATADLDEALASDVEVLYYCGLGKPLEVAHYLGRLAEAGKDAITLTGLIHPPTAIGQEAAAQLDAQAVRGGGRILGAGWNPGFLLDVLPVIWGSSCVRIEHVFAQRVAEMRDWGPGVHTECGIGLPPEEVTDTDSNPLHESVALVADGLGIELDKLENFHEPYVSRSRRAHGERVVLPGHNAGFHKRALGYNGGKGIIEIEMYGIFCIDPDEDPVEESAVVRVHGESTVESWARGDWFGDSYPVTAARAIRAAGPLGRMPPGLYRPDQIPLSV